MKYLFIAIFWIAILVASPFITLWAINTVFGLGLEMTVPVWFGIAWLHLAASGGKV